VECDMHTVGVVERDRRAVGLHASTDGLCRPEPCRSGGGVAGRHELHGGRHPARMRAIENHSTIGRRSFGTANARRTGCRRRSPATPRGVRASCPRGDRSRLREGTGKRSVHRVGTPHGNQTTAGGSTWVRGRKGGLRRGRWRKTLGQRPGMGSAVPSGMLRVRCVRLWRLLSGIDRSGECTSFAIPTRSPTSSTTVERRSCVCRRPRGRARRRAILEGARLTGR
jgi:hypothetical protein